jgi:hypothetical protein
MNIQTSSSGGYNLNGQGNVTVLVASTAAFNSQLTVIVPPGQSYLLFGTALQNCWELR